MGIEQKKTIFEKFQGLVLGWVEEIDAKGIDVAQPIVRLSYVRSKTGKNIKNAYVNAINLKE